LLESLFFFFMISMLNHSFYFILFNFSIYFLINLDVLRYFLLCTIFIILFYLSILIYSF
jgi:hypothetical protein